MKKLILLLVLIISIISCQTDEINDASTVSEVNDVEKGKHETQGTRGIYNPVGKMFYEGNNIWSGIVAGVKVYFEGASPAQISNGYRSSWQVRSLPYPNQYSNGVKVEGDGNSGFTVEQSVLGISTSYTITRYRLVYLEEVNSGVTIGDRQYERWTVKLPFTTFGSGSRVKTSAKIGFDENCAPIIIHSGSDTPMGCGGNITINPW